jgi:hypothetical protein
LINQYVNGFEQLILFARKELDQDGELNSIEFTYFGYSQQINSIVVSLLIKNLFLKLNDDAEIYFI